MHEAQTQGREVDFIELKEENEGEKWNPSKQINCTGIADHSECGLVGSAFAQELGEQEIQNGGANKGHPQGGKHHQ